MGVKDPSLWPVVLLAVMVVVAGIASLRRRKEIKELQQRGIHIMATVIAVEERTSCNTSVEVYPSFPNTRYAVRAKWRDPRTGEVYIFTSAWLSSRPEMYTEGSPISVLIDPNDPRRYHVEV